MTAPIRGEAAGDAADKAVASAINLPAVDAKSAVPLTEAGLRERYAGALNAVYADALERREVELFVDVLAWKLAVIAHRYGPKATAMAMRNSVTVGFRSSHDSQHGERHLQSTDGGRGVAQD